QKQLFENEDPVGKYLRLSNISLRVVGVLSRKGASMFGSDQDDVIIAPWTTIKYRISGKTSSASSAQQSSAASTSVNTLDNLYPNSDITLYPVQSDIQAADTPQPVHFANINSIQLAATSAADIPLAIKQITDILRERHRLRDNEPDDFQIRDMTEIMNTFASVTALTTQLLHIVATISLIVG